MEDFIDPWFFLNNEYIDKFTSLYNNWIYYNDKASANAFINYYRSNKRELACSFIVLYEQGCTDFPCDALFKEVLYREFNCNFHRVMQIKRYIRKINEFWYIFLKEIYSTL